MEPHSLVGGMGKVVPSGRAWPAASKTNASWPAHQLGRAGEVVYCREEKWKPERLLSAFSQKGYPATSPSPPSRWAGRYGPFTVRAAGQVTSEKYSLPHTTPPPEGSPEEEPLPSGVLFPYFFPRNGAPAGQAIVPCRSNGVRKDPQWPPPGRAPFPPVPTAQKSPQETGSRREIPPRRLLPFLSLLIWTRLSRPRPSRSFFWRPARRWGQVSPDAPGQRGCSGRSCRPPPSSSARTPAPRTTWS